MKTKTKNPARPSAKAATKTKPDPKFKPAAKLTHSPGYGLITGEFEDANVSRDLSIVLPKRRCPVLARPGMAVALINQASDYGYIQSMTAKACKVRDTAGKLISVPWGEIELVDVRPDPAFLMSATPRPAVQEYSPRLHNWICPNGNPAADDYAPRTFSIYEKVGDFGRGAKVATVTVEPEFSEEAVKRIAAMIEHSPELYRQLRDLNRWEMIDEVGALGPFGENLALLYEAGGGVFPYSAPCDRDDDEPELASEDKDVAALAAAQGRPLPKATAAAEVVDTMVENIRRNVLEAEQGKKARAK